MKPAPIVDREIVRQTIKSVLFSLVIRASANITELASVIDKPRSYFRPEQHQIESVIKVERQRQRWMDASCD